MDESLERSHRHISRQFNTDLQTLHQHVLEMGGIVQQQLENAGSALINNDESLAETVIANDYRVNAMEVSIDEESTYILARRQPAAGDLRMVMAVIKTITDLERIGDEAERIARMAAHKSGHALGHHQQLLPHVHLSVEHLNDLAQSMLKQALDAFARMDVELAFQVAKRDVKVDQEYDGLIRQLITYMMEDPRSIPMALDIMWAARSLERIGDRACNICEYVIYFVKGKDVRHIDLELVQVDLHSEEQPAGRTAE